MQLDKNRSHSFKTMSNTKQCKRNGLLKGVWCVSLPFAHVQPLSYGHSMAKTEHVNPQGLVKLGISVKEAEFINQNSA